MTIKVEMSGIFTSFDIFRLPARRAVKEIMEVVDKESKASFNRQKSKKNRHRTGALIASFEKTDIKQDGATVFSGIVFAGGPDAPYTPIVEHIGWKYDNGTSKPPYHFMLEGRNKGREAAREIVIKHFSKVL